MKKKIFAWMMYDWGISTFSTSILSAILPIFYMEVAVGALKNTATATSYWTFTLSAMGIVSALLMPLLGAAADYSKSNMSFLRISTLIGSVATALMACIQQGNYVLASALLIVGGVSFSSSSVFYDAMLKSLVPEEKRDFTSAMGFALGYLGSGILLVINLIMIQNHDLLHIPDQITGMRISFISVGLWWTLFALPLFITGRKKEKRFDKARLKFLSIGVSRIKDTIKSIKKYPELLKFFIASIFFGNGIYTVTITATVYGRSIGIGTPDLIKGMIISIFIGVPSTILFGKLASLIGDKVTLIISLCVFSILVILEYNMTNALQFHILAAFLGLIQGTSQSVTRSIFSKLVPGEKVNELFGFMSFCGRFMSILGSAAFSLVTVLTNSTRYGILANLFFFVVGILILITVNFKKGIRETNINEAPLLSDSIQA